MKVRTGFVSNSSSSSFICSVCGHTESGWDMSIDEANMCECVNNHVLCTDHIPDLIDTPAYELPAEHCPCCKFAYLDKDDMTTYLLKINNTTREELAKKIRETFSSFDDFDKWLKEKKA